MRRIPLLLYALLTIAVSARAQEAAAVQTAVTDSALAVFMREISGILQRVPDEELQRAKNYVALGYPQTFETP